MTNEHPRSDPVVNTETNTTGLQTLPVLALKNTVLFPYLVMPLTAGRVGSVAAVETALASEDKHIVLLTQRDGSVEEPGLEDLHSVGTLGVIKKINRADGAIHLLV